MSVYAGRVLNGRYRLIRSVGVGSQAAVWVAEHLALTTQVAVKLIDPDLAKRPDARERFKREATAAATLRSPHVVQILDHGIDGDQPFIVMELLEGEDLFARLEKRHHLSLKDTSKIITQLARALTRAHAAGVVHRDLKPENVFLTHNDDDEIVKVLDFGVAKVRDAAKVTMQKTGVGTLIGTPHYMSPEQVKGIGEVDFRTDLWAMGIIAYQCVTGELPFDSEGVGDLLIKITIGEMPVPSKVMLGVLPAFDAWFARACDRDAARRFASARAAAEGLARIAGLAAAGSGSTAVPRPGASIPPPMDPSKRPSDLPPPPSPSKATRPPAPPLAPAPAPAAEAKPARPASMVDDEEWEVADPGGSIAPPANPDEPEASPLVPAAPRLPALTPAAAAQEDEPQDDFEDAELDSDLDNAAADAPDAAPPPASPRAAAPAAVPARAVTPAPTAPAGPVNPFLVNDFVAPQSPPSSPAAVAPPPAPSSTAGMAAPSRPHPTAPQQQYVFPGAQQNVSQSSAAGYDSSALDDDDELAFGRNRRKKLVRWFLFALLLLAAGVTWMVVSSQLRARDPVVDPATIPTATASVAPPPSAFDPVPSPTPSTSATSTAPPKLTGRLRPGNPPGTGQPPVRGPKKPNDGSVEIPTPGEDLPPPAP